MKVQNKQKGTQWFMMVYPRCNVFYTFTNQNPTPISPAHNVPTPAHISSCRALKRTRQFHPPVPVQQT